MLTLILNSYKLLFKQFRAILVLALPLLIISIADIYFQPAAKIKYSAYAIMLIMPLVSAATDISIYRRLFQYNIINPLSSINAFIVYLLSQIVIGIIGTAPIYLFQYLFVAIGVPYFWSLTIAILLNIPTGFLIMARFNIILPLIIQNKIPSWKEFLNYTSQPLRQWLLVATIIYLPYVILHYLTINCAYTNMIITTFYMFIFICFNVTYVNNNRLSNIKYKPAEYLVKEAEVIISEQKNTISDKTEDKEEKTEKKQPAKKNVKKQEAPKTSKKSTKPKLKPVTA